MKNKYLILRITQDAKGQRCVYIPKADTIFKGGDFIKVIKVSVK